MKWIGRILQTRRALVAPIAIVLFASVAVAATSQLSLPGGNCDVVAVVTADANGAEVEFIGNIWEEEIDLSIRVDGNGDILVNGVSIGSANGTSKFRITVKFDGHSSGDYSVDVFVQNDETGAVLGSKLDIMVSSDVSDVEASGLVVHSLSAN